MVNIANDLLFKFSDHNDYTKNPYRIVCYYIRKANSYKIGPFKIEDIDTTICTHISYAFAKMNEVTYEIEAFDPYWDLKNGTGYKSEFFTFS